MHPITPTVEPKARRSSTMGMMRRACSAHKNALGRTSANCDGCAVITRYGSSKKRALKQAFISG
jgi:hypothetical protein